MAKWRRRPLATICPEIRTDEDNYMYHLKVPFLCQEKRNSKDSWLSIRDFSSRVQPNTSLAKLICKDSLD